MLWVEMEEDLTALAAGLAGLLAQPVADPMAPEWIVVPSAGIDRWLRLQLAGRLGASGADTGDGIAANLQVLYPGRFTRLVLDDATNGAQRDLWDVDHLTWVVLGVLDRHADDPALASVTELPEGATRWSRARRLADQFDRYMVHRPQMVVAWEQGQPVDPWGVQLPARARWQPHLWQLVVEHAGTASPARTRLDRLGALRAGNCPDTVPARLSLFGLTSIPGGAPFVELLDALAQHRDVHLYLPQPSLAMAGATLVRSAPAVGAPPRRTDDSSIEQVHHPLLRSWARSARETVQLLGPRAVAALETQHPTGDTDSLPVTLLHRLQADLRADRRPEPTFVPDTDDRSVLIHSCHGTTRQVEVLRDQLLHLLAQDPSLSEDDILVMSPALEKFAPIIEAVWGPSADQRSAQDPAGAGAPALRYRITDRSLGSSVPMVAALGALVDLLDSQFSGLAVLEFANLAPVRERYGFDDTDLALFADWVEETNLRWGLSGQHRAPWGVPAEYVAGTWRRALDRLLVGVMLADDGTSTGLAGTVPIAVEGEGVAALGRLADLLGRLAELCEQSRGTRPPTDWIQLLRSAAGQLFAPPRAAQWQEAQLDALLDDIAQAAATVGGDRVDLTLSDVRAMVGRGIRRSAGRADFFRGGVTVSSLTPLRGVPHRVICLLGLDEPNFASPAQDGDDLIAAAPAVGDLDRRAETRHAVLDAVLATGQHLIITRTGRSIVTNQEVPPAVVVSELVEVLTGTLQGTDGERAKSFLPVQPCQSYDQRNFIAGGIGRAAGASTPWSFDPVALSGALGRTTSTATSSEFLPEPLPSDVSGTIEVADLRSFLEHPVRHFLRDRLGVVLRERDEGTVKVSSAAGDAGPQRSAGGQPLALSLDPLERWKIGEQLLAHRRAGGEPDTFEARRLAIGDLPPGRLARVELDEATKGVQALVDSLGKLGLIGCPSAHVPIDVTLGSGHRLVGNVRVEQGDRPGPLTATYSRWSAKHLIGPWLDLLALTANDPSSPWCAVVVARTPSSGSNGARTEVLQVRGTTETERRERARTALDALVDLCTRGRCEPLPLFPTTSWALHQGRKADNDWSPYDRPGEQGDRWNHLVFGDLDVEGLCELPCQSWDPDGRGETRALRYAHLLWDTYGESLQADGDERSPA